MAGYVPRVLLCGDESSFKNAASEMPIEIVGKISFKGSAERGEIYIFNNPEDAFAYVPKDFRIFLNGEEISVDELKKILDGTADYIVFDDGMEIIARQNDLHANRIIEQAVTRETLFRQARHNFYAPKILYDLADLLRDNKISRLLDVDALFAETDFFLFDDLFPTVDAVAENLEPIHESFYRRIYASLDDCRFKIYDALLIAEREPQSFVDTLIETNDLAATIVTFARKNSALENWLVNNAAAFEKIVGFKSACRKIFASTSSRTRIPNSTRCPKVTKSFTPDTLKPSKLSAT